jgi:hypothetical protein
MVQADLLEHGYPFIHIDMLFHTFIRVHRLLFSFVTATRP